LNDCLSTYCGFVVTNPKPLPQKKTPPKEKPSPTMNSADKFVSEETMNLLLDEEPLWLIELAAYVEEIFPPNRKLNKLTRLDFQLRNVNKTEEEFAQRSAKIRNRCEKWKLRGKPVKGAYRKNAALILFQDDSLLLSRIKTDQDKRDSTSLIFDIDSYHFDDGVERKLKRVILDDTWGDVHIYKDDRVNNSYLTRMFSEVTTLELPESFAGSIIWTGDKLVQVHVDSGNKTYYSEDGVLYRKDTNELVFYPGGKIGDVFKIPYDSVHDFETMEEGIFGSCPKTLIIGKEVRRLGKEVWTLGESSDLKFFDADKLEKIVFQGEKIMIGPEVFINHKLERGLYTIDIECPTNFDFEYVKNGWIRYSANRCVHCGRKMPLLRKKCTCGKRKAERISDFPNSLDLVKLRELLKR